MVPDAKHPSQAWRKTAPKIEDAIGAAFGLVVAIGLVVAFIMGGRWVTDHATWEWLGGAYIVIGLICGGVCAIGLFGALWFWAANRHGLAGFAIGWAPAGIAAALSFFLVLFLWLPLAVIGGLVWKLARL